jgi:glycosyltransferase involved in cell wall biosynthesis
MKVLVFTTLYPNNMQPNHGVFIKERMTHFSRLHDCEIRVMAPVPYFPPARFSWRFLYSQVSKSEAIEGVKVYHPRYFMVPKIGMVLYGLMIFLSILPAIRRLRREFDFDLIDAHYVYPDGFAGVLLSHYFKKPVVVSARGTDISLYKNYFMIRKLLKFTLSRASQVVAVSHSLKKEIIELGIQEEMISVIPNGIDSDKFYPLSQVSARNALGLPVERKIILSVGRLVPVKGLDLLIRAIKIIIENNLYDKEIYLIIIGKGSLEKELENLALNLGLRRYVRFIGEIPHTDLCLWYNAADVFCLASKREGWPNVLMESLACGTPVVAADIVSVPEIVSSNRNGFITKRTPHAFAEKIILAIRKEWDKGEFRQFSLEKGWKNGVQQLYGVFCGAVENHDK